MSDHSGPKPKICRIFSSTPFPFPGMLSDEIPSDNADNTPLFFGELPEDLEYFDSEMRQVFQNPYKRKERTSLCDRIKQICSSFEGKELKETLKKCMKSAQAHLQFMDGLKLGESLGCGYIYGVSPPPETPAFIPSKPVDRKRRRQTFVKQDQTSISEDQVVKAEFSPDYGFIVMDKSGRAKLTMDPKPGDSVVSDKLYSKLTQFPRCQHSKPLEKPGKIETASLFGLKKSTDRECVGNVLILAQFCKREAVFESIFDKGFGFILSGDNFEAMRLNILVSALHETESVAVFFYFSRQGYAPKLFMGFPQCNAEACCLFMKPILYKDNMKQLELPNLEGQVVDPSTLRAFETLILTTPCAKKPATTINQEYVWATAMAKTKKPQTFSVPLGNVDFLEYMVKHLNLDQDTRRFTRRKLKDQEKPADESSEKDNRRFRDQALKTLSKVSPAAKRDRPT